MFISGKSVADELRTLRDRKNLTAEEVSKTIGIHPNTLYKYEKGFIISSGYDGTDNEPNSTR